MTFKHLVLALGIGLATSPSGLLSADASSLQGKVLCGYQGWFRCPGDAANMGWVHWSRDGRHLTPAALKTRRAHV
eukprot:gene16487-20150_t